MMIKILVIAAMLAASPALADNVDDAWAICQSHRSVQKMPNGVTALLYGSGFESCGDVEFQIVQRKNAASKARFDDEIARLKSLQQNQK